MNDGEQLILDRMEGDWLVCETQQGTHLRLPAQLLPHGVKEGEALLWQNNCLTPDPERTLALRQEMLALSRKLFGEE